MAAVRWSGWLGSLCVLLSACGTSPEATFFDGTPSDDAASPASGGRLPDATEGGLPGTGGLPWNGGNPGRPDASAGGIDSMGGRNPGSGGKSPVGGTSSGGAATGGSGAGGTSSGGASGSGGDGSAASGGLSTDSGIDASSGGTATDADAGDGAGGAEECTTLADCADGEFCLKAIGDCEGPGVCARLPKACLPMTDRVCGCDKNTYESRCAAFQQGVNVAAAEACRMGGCNREARENCCFKDADCGPAARCVAELACEDEGVCKPRMPGVDDYDEDQDACWETSDCPPHHLCVNVQICGCGLNCLVADHPGTCEEDEVALH